MQELRNSIDHFPMMLHICESLIITPQIIRVGQQHALQMYYILWGNPTSARIPACKLCLGIATHESTATFVEQIKRGLSAAICCIPMRPSLMEIHVKNN